MANAKRFEELNEQIMDANEAVDTASEAPKKLAYKLPGNLEAKTKELYGLYMDEERVEVMIAPMYADHFGRVMTVTINGISVRVPCDGTRVKVPATFAAEINRRLTLVNERIAREKGLKDNAIYEQSPGEVSLF